MKKQHIFYFLAVFVVLFTTCKKEIPEVPDVPDIPDIPVTTDIPATGIMLNQNELTLIPGDTITLMATVQPDSATNKNVTWKSSDTTVATVTNNGLVTAIAIGEANIIATTQDGNLTDSCAVMIVDYRTRWLGDWDFVQYNYNFSFGWVSRDTTYYSGKISLGKTSYHLNVNGRELQVCEDGLLVGFDGPCGSFSGNDRIHIYFSGGTMNGSQEWSISISGIKKKE